MKRCILFVFMLLMAASLCAQADTVISRYREYLLRHTRPDWEQVRLWTRSLDGGGQWGDINYEDQQRANWKAPRHLERTLLMAVAWASSSSPLYQDAEVFVKVRTALDHWLQKRYQNSNWWHNQIGVPQYMRDIIVLLQDTMDLRRMKEALAVMGQLRVLGNGQGANLVWSANLGLHYGALRGDSAQMQQCRNLLLNEIQLTTGEGIQPDYSYHQHDKRLQIYHYGTAFLWDNVRIAWLLRGTPWAYPAEKLKLLRGMILQGWQWMARGIYTVPGTVDRSVSRVDALKSADIRELIPYLCDLWPEDTVQFRRLEAIQSGLGALEGYRYFPYSDFAAYHREDFSFFVKTVSDRTLPTESINSENLRGQLLHSGDTYLVRDGGEYVNLMPAWDWDHLPGVTSFKGAWKIIRRPFTGSVSNGTSGLSVMDYRMESRDKQQGVSARKFWASHGGRVVCLIGGLQTSAGEIYTTLDQSRWRGTVTVNRPGQQVGEGMHGLKSVKWIHHSGFAYIPLGREPVDLQLKTASGTWRSINQGLSDSVITENIFMPVLRHGVDAKGVSTGYVLASCATPRQAQTLARRPDWKVLRNDKDCQAVLFGDGTLMAAFYEPGQVTIPYSGVLGVDKPCLVLIAGQQLFASSPVHKEESVHVQFGGKNLPLLLPGHGLTSKGVSIPDYRIK